jgi:5'-3' exonuclease
MEDLVLDKLPQAAPTVTKMKPTLEGFAYSFDRKLREFRKKLYNDYNDKNPKARVNQGLGKMLIIAELETIDIVRTSFVEAWKEIGGLTRDPTPDE